MVYYQYITETEPQTTIIEHQWGGPVVYNQWGLNPPNSSPGKLIVCIVNMEHFMGHTYIGMTQTRCMNLPAMRSHLQSWRHISNGQRSI